jgi:hypothetical protein
MTVDLIISIILLGLALFILLWFFGGLIFASSRELSTYKLKSSLKRKVTNLESAAKLEMQGKFTEALEEIKNSLILENGPWSHAFIEQVTNHHMNALSQLVSLAEKLDHQLSDLPIAEGLFITRSELLRSFSDTSKASENMKKKLKERGTEQQSWAYAEITRKLDELKDKLSTNKRTINSKYDEIVKKLTRSPVGGADFTYH